jgi:hypothetical protein
MAAQLQVISFLGAAFGILVLGLGAVGVRLAGRRALSLRLGLSAVICLAGYTLLLVGAGLASHDVTLGSGAEKYFCEIDCHLAYRVSGLAAASEIGPAASPLRPSGVFQLVTLETRFDETTIAPWRPRDVPVYPNPRVIRLVDRNGRRYPPSAEGEAALKQVGGAGIAVDAPLTPGASYATTLVFDLPADAKPDRLLVTDDIFVNRFMIGHEQSPFHGKVYLTLPASG